MKSASFGFELPGINNNAASFLIPVNADMTIVGLDIDISMMPTAKTSKGGYEEILCLGLLFDKKPVFTGGKLDFPTFVFSSDFGAIETDNPNGLTTVFGGALFQGGLWSVILKTWDDVSDVASETHRHITSPMNLIAKKGSYIVCYFDQQSIASPAGCDVELQGVIRYTLNSPAPA